MSTILAVRGRLKRIFPWYPAFREWFRHNTTGNWEAYYNGGHMPDAPEECLEQLKIPAYIDTVLELGCGNGRNFLAYEGKKLWAIDLVPKERINWIKPFDNLQYEQISVEGLTQRLEKHPIDLSKTLVISLGTMMMVPKKWQYRFYEVCLRCGCKNFIFQDFEPGNIRHPYYHLKLPLDQFKVQMFKPHPTQSRTFYQLDI